MYRTTLLLLSASAPLLQPGSALAGPQSACKRITPLLRAPSCTQAGAFVLVFCGLNWASLRRVRKEVGAVPSVQWAGWSQEWVVRRPGNAQLLC